MKSEHRHELAENDLSKLLGRGAEKFDEHANKILSAIVVVALIAAGFIYWTRTSQYRQANGWTDLAASSSPEQYETVADAFSGTVVGDWARLRAANGFLQEGIRLSLSDRPAGNDRLEQAHEAFESLATAESHPAVREQAQLGLAVTLESQSNGDTEPAIAAYQKLLDEFPQTRFKEWAHERISALKTGSAQEFYAWFHEQNPKPPDMPLPNDQGRPSTGALDDILGGSGLPSSSGAPLGGTPFDELSVPLGGSGKSSESTTDDDVNPFAEPTSDDSSGENAAEDDTGGGEKESDEGTKAARGETDSGDEPDAAPPAENGSTSQEPSE